MAYADQQMSGNKVTALIIVALIHVAVGYALVTGLAYSAAQEIIKKVTTVDIKEEVKKEEEPPPPEPPKDVPPPPIVAPPPPINVATVPPPVTTVVTAPPPPPVIVPVAAPPPVPAPPPPRYTPKPASPKGRYTEWATTDDYPSRALRDEKEGVTRIRVSVGPDGRVTGCEVTGSSGTPELDSTTCTLITRRGRFNPATDGEGQPTSSSWSTSIRWQIPKD